MIRLGLANLVAPAVANSAVWLTRYAPGADLATARATATEVDPGAVLDGPVRLPAGEKIVQQTVRGLLLAPAAAHAGVVTSRLWDPSAPQAGRSFSRVLAVGPAGLAWRSRCAPGCAIKALDLASGRITTLALPAGAAVTSGAFSPDGNYLALQVSLGGAGRGGGQLAVLPVFSGQLTFMPSTFVSSDALVAFGWPAGGDSLVAEFSFAARRQLASWQPGDPRAAVVPVRPGASPSSLILG